MNFMANPVIYRSHYKFPYISLYLESLPPPLPVAWAACLTGVTGMNANVPGPWAVPGLFLFRNTL